VYRARIGLFGTNRSKVRRENTTNKWGELQECLLFGILIAVMLVIGGIETNPGPQIEEEMEILLDHMVAHREEGDTTRELLDRKN
jgi:hypothetical protein